ASLLLPGTHRRGIGRQDGGGRTLQRGGGDRLRLQGRRGPPRQAQPQRMSGEKKLDPRLRRHLLSLKRAGLEYVAASRFDVSRNDLASATPAPEPTNEPTLEAGRDAPTDRPESSPTMLFGDEPGRPAPMTVNASNKDEALAILAAEVAQCV